MAQRSYSHSPFRLSKSDKLIIFGLQNYDDFKILMDDWKKQGWLRNPGDTRPIVQKCVDALFESGLLIPGTPSATQGRLTWRFPEGPPTDKQLNALTPEERWVYMMALIPIVKGSEGVMAAARVK